MLLLIFNDFTLESSFIFALKTANYTYHFSKSKDEDRHSSQVDQSRCPLQQLIRLRAS